MAKKMTRALTVQRDLNSTALVPILGSPRAAAKIAGQGGSFRRDQGTILIEGRPYLTRLGAIDADEIYYVDGLKPSENGPWLGEADKIAWRDPASGFECIMMRETRGAHLCGYVGVPRLHPLWGFEHDAIPADLGIEVHGGLSYSQICEDGPTPERRIVTEARRICHVVRSPARFAPTTTAADYRVEDVHAWWFGFACNQIYDVVPGDQHHAKRSLGAETGQVYRDDAYVLNEIGNLAAQLRAIELGEAAPPRNGPPPPPVGLNPANGA